MDIEACRDRQKRLAFAACEPDSTGQLMTSEAYVSEAIAEINTVDRNKRVLV